MRKNMILIDAKHNELNQNFAYWCKVKEITCASDDEQFNSELCFLHSVISQGDNLGLNEIDVIEAKRLIYVYGKPLLLERSYNEQILGGSYDQRHYGMCCFFQ